tara:strand:+ start:25916 stop:26344 length:429 start_codon:yes stop_codon:yes gene_type:complete
VIAPWWRGTFFWIALGLGPVYWLLHWWVFGLGTHAWQLDGRYLLLVIVYPVLEECVYRGLLQAQLQKAAWLPRTNWPVPSANLITSAVFAATHLFTQGVMGLLTFFPSLVLGAVFDRYGRLAPTILLHIVYNAGYLLLFSGD